MVDLADYFRNLSLPKEIGSSKDFIPNMPFKVGTPLILGDPP